MAPSARDPTDPPIFCRRGPLANWNFDDCNSSRTELRDNFRGFTAYRTVGAVCVPGIEGQAVSLPREKDLVYVPDQPEFTSSSERMRRLLRVPVGLAGDPLRGRQAAEARD